MDYKTIAKKIIKFEKRVFKCLYSIFYMKPVIEYKKHGCAAVNDFRVNKSFQYRSNSYYPALMTKKPSKAKRIYKRVVNFDENGLPVVKNHPQPYWPVTVIQFGLLNYNFFLTYKEKKYENSVLSVCNWLVSNIANDGTWQHHIQYHCTIVDEDIFPPFTSAMVQGEAIALLVRGYKISSDIRYLDTAGKALSPYNISVAEHGVLDYIDNHPFYEEYPTTTPSFVLNGFLFSLFGLYDLANETHPSAEMAKQLFEEGYRTLIHILPLYDGGFCSRYDLSHLTIAPNNDNKNPLYHPIHINQLIAMNYIKPSKVLEFYIREWS